MQGIQWQRQWILFQIKRQTAVQPPKKNLSPFQTDEVLRESLYMFDTQKIESTNNAIAYVAPKKDYGAYHELKQ